MDTPDFNMLVSSCWQNPAMLPHSAALLQTHPLMNATPRHGHERFVILPGSIDAIALG
jgi:hypothetical protein